MLLLVWSVMAYALEIPQGKIYFDNSKTRYGNVKFVFGSNSRAETHILTMTDEGSNRFSVTIDAAVSDMYRYTFAATSLPDGVRAETFNTVKDNISNSRKEYRTATRDDVITPGWIFTPLSGDNWTQGTWQPLNVSGEAYSGTLPLLCINTGSSNVAECCTYVADRYFAYFVNSEKWEDVGCYVWDNSYYYLAGNWPGSKCEKVGITTDGDEIWRWVSDEDIADVANAPTKIIFNNNQSTGGQTKDLTFKNGGYYTYDLETNASPKIRITSTGVEGTGEPITSKDTYVQGTYYIDAMGIEGYENLGSKEEPLPLQIKGRGNYTWKDFDKKPYRLKFDSKASPLGMNKSKHFTLLAHADDNLAFLRNTVGFELSRLLGLAYTPEQRPVEVCLNGEYIGLYMLTDKIRVDKSRVNIVEQADKETDPDAITGGWLVEIDNYDEDPQVVITEGNGATIRFTYHTPEELSEEQYNYLYSAMTKLNNAIYTNNKSNNGWEVYVDLDALVKFYIVQEVMDNAESFHGSCYLYKDRGSDTKWTFGPVWDFGNSYHRGYDKFIYDDSPFGQIWIGEIAKFPHFQERVKHIWQRFLGKEYKTLDSFIDNFITQISSAAVSDAARWPYYGTNNPTERKNRFKSSMSQKVDFLTREWGGPIEDGIDDIVNDVEPIDIDNTVHDLSGRVVSTTGDTTALPAGIYIQNHKKIVVR